LQAALVVQLRRERAKGGMHSPGAIEEEAAILRDRRMLAVDQVDECRNVGSVRMRASPRLLELLRVAQQDEVPRRARRREGVGERELSGLVDEQVVKHTLGV